MVLFVLLFEEIQFLSWSFTFLAMTKSSRGIFCLFVAWNIHTVVFLPIFVFYLLLFSLSIVLFVLFLVSMFFFM